MRNFLVISLLTLFTFACNSQDKSDEIRLLVRGDDIGSFHAANIGCIKSYTEGVMQSVEVMVPCPWFPEAVRMLNENPGLDVGVHLVLTSEWSAMKWRPLTGISSITDDWGYFYPMVWPNDNFPPEKAFRESSWTLEDVEKELRAQIELAMAQIKNVSHISSHMVFESASEDIQALLEKLAKEYGLYIDMSDVELKRLKFSKERDASYQERAEAMAEAILNLGPGTYIYVEHPGLDTPELEAIGHIGYTGVGKDRGAVTYMFTSEVVKEAIRKKGVKLISYQDL